VSLTAGEAPSAVSVPEAVDFSLMVNGEVPAVEGDVALLDPPPAP
jgi:hypothetical protein